MFVMAHLKIIDELYCHEPEFLVPEIGGVASTGSQKLLLPLPAVEFWVGHAQAGSGRLSCPFGSVSLTEQLGECWSPSPHPKGVLR